MPFVPDQVAPAASAGRFVPDAAPSASTGAPDNSKAADIVAGLNALPAAETGAGEANAEVATGSLSAPIAGIAGLITGYLHSLGMLNAHPADAVRAVQSALTYAPRTAQGKGVTAAINAPFRMLGNTADVAGEKAAEVTGSPAVGSAVNTAVQALPGIVLHRFGAPEEAAATEEEAPAAAESTMGEPENVTRAKEYVARRTNLDWNSLAGAVRSRLEQIAQDSDTLNKLDPQALERQARLESLPVPIKATKGQITRDTAQLNNEGTLAATDAGAPLRDVRNAQSQAILDNLAVLKGKVTGTGARAGTAQTPEDVGLSVQDAALRAKLRLQQQKVSALYKQAGAAGELQGPVSVKPVQDVIDQSPDLTHLGWVQSWLNKMGVTKTEATGGTTVETTRPVSLKEMEDLRQAAVAKAMNGGADGYYAGKVIRAIDQATEGAGGEAYQAARAARKQQALEFEDPGAIARLVENKSRTDRATALEDTWQKTVLGGSIDDLNRVKRSLLTGGDETTRTAGVKAWRDIRAQTLQYITDRATRGSAPLSDGTTPVSAPGMKQAIDAIGPQKLEAIFGPGTVKRIRQIMQATQDVRTEPPSIHPGSSTMGNIAAFLERSIGRVPYLGDTVSGAVRGVGKLREMGREGRETRAAQQTPLDEGVQSAQAAQRANETLSALRRGSAAVPSSIAVQQYFQGRR